ncbi:MAG: PQQ-binding-like beta-propeller repeat protein [Planctomycetota bacterium]
MKLNRCRIVFALASLLVLIGCNAAKTTETRTVPPGAEFRTGLAFEPGFANQFGYSFRWARSIDLQSGQTIEAVVPLGEHLVTVEQPENVVTAINLSDGSTAWKTILGEPLEVFVGAVGDKNHIYINSSRRFFKLQRRNGDIVELFNLPLPVNMTPLLVDNLAIFGSVNGWAYAFDVNKGFRKWTYGLKNQIFATPVQDNDTVFVADSDGNYAMLALRSGELRWRGSTFGDLSAAPVRDRFNMVVASEDQSMYSFASNTGLEAWPAYRSEVPLSETPVVIDDVIYLAEPGVGLTAVSANSGEAQWQIAETYQPITGLKGKLIATGDQVLLRIDPADGRVVQSVPTRELQSAINGPDGSLLLVTPGGEIVRIDPHQ